MTNAVWVSNIIPTNQFHFMTVVYPVKPGEADPTFTRLDDYTVQVQIGTNNDVISFDATTTQPVNYLVPVANPPHRPTAPTNLRSVP
jgi:hypothetical protein